MESEQFPGESCPERPQQRITGDTLLAWQEEIFLQSRECWWGQGGGVVRLTLKHRYQKIYSKPDLFFMQTLLFFKNFYLI